VAAVEIGDIEKRFGAVVALDGVSVTLADGAVTAILGPSGCGKTTLLRLIAGLETPDAGTIAIGGRDVTAEPPERRRLGMMFQSYALLPHMTVGENLRFPLRMRGIGTPAEQARAVSEALALVRLEGHAARYPRQLSGGQQQRVALARALIGEPRVLLLDEPLSNLDAQLRKDMQVELIELHKQLGLTTVIVTHDQEEALSLADHVVLLRQGRIEQQGTPREIYARPATAFAAAFLGGANLLPVAVRREGERWVAELAPGIAVAVEPPRDAGEGARQLMLRPEDLRLATAGGVPVTVIETVFQGAQSRCVVALGPHRLAVVTAKGETHPSGAARFLDWDRAAALVL
jgi:ABC-type Fe3+/spermidine/putrescine transport system ATPase subunit